MTKPSNNTITQGYSSSHPGLDYSGKGDPNVYAPKSGVITISKDGYKTNWLQGKEGDPTPWGLTTEDYGNFLKIKHDDGTFSLQAHLKNGTLLKVGTRVTEGQKIAEIGNTGNSTGPHLHFELRDSNNKNIKPVFQGKENNMSESQSALPENFSEIVGKSSQRDYLVGKMELVIGTSDEKELYNKVSSIIAGYKGQITQKDEEIKQLKEETTSTPILQGKRKMLVAIVTPIVAIVGKILADKFGVELDQEAVVSLVLAGIAYIGFEGSKDIIEVFKGWSVLNTKK